MYTCKPKIIISRSLTAAQLDQGDAALKDVRVPTLYFIHSKVRSCPDYLTTTIPGAYKNIFINYVKP